MNDVVAGAKLAEFIFKCVKAMGTAGENFFRFILI